jgi:hypothetical protein
VTDRMGLAWIPEGAHSRWSFDFEDLEAIAWVAGLQARKINLNTYVVCRGTPLRPALGSRLRSSVRGLAALAARAVSRTRSWSRLAPAAAIDARGHPRRDQ